MKQLLQNLKKGEILLEEIPLPNCGQNEVLIKTEKSLISPGTERMLLEFGRSLYIQKARQQPDKVKLVLTDPSATTKEYVSSLLDKLDFDTNKVLHIIEKIDFVSLIKKSALTIRATRTDGDSLSIRESLYSGVLVIASDVTTRPEGTIIFKNEDVEDLEHKIELALEEKDNFDYEDVNYGNKIIQQYQEVLKSNT